MRLFNEEQEKEIINLYINGLSEIKIANKHNITRGVIHKILVKNDIAFRPNNISPLSKNQINEIPSLYNSGLSATVIGKIYNVNNSIIIKYLKRFGITPIRYNKKYTYNEHYFDVIDTPEKAYWFGDLCADGYVKYDINNTNYVIVLCVAIKDIMLIEKLRESIHGNMPIYILDKPPHYWRPSGRRTKSHITPPTKHAAIHICCKHMAYQLINKGCGQCKTHTLQWPTNNIVPDRLKPFFMLGYVDGDGCWATSIRNNLNGSIHVDMSFSFQSSLEFCKGAQKWLIEKCSLNETKILFADNIWKVAYGGNNQIKRIYNLLYDHENLPYHLQRKEDRLKSFIFS
jgi:predicted DNA-binding protein YlxM (UPF0122 family)